MAVVLSAADRGLNYSVQQVTKESLYVPLSDVEKYKAKAFIDMIVDRSAKALSALALVAIIAFEGVSVTISLAVTLGALAIWALCAALLGRAYKRRIAKADVREKEQRGREKERERAVGHARPRYGTQ
jgi:AAA family ATP:ADP antiporter